MISLCGEWEMRSESENEWHSAQVPGTVYTDLIRGGLMEDPFFGLNEIPARELSGKDYYYRKRFVLPKFPRFDLVCEGIDTLAEIRINGKRVGRCENMHRTWRFPVTKFLTSGENEIEIHFYSPLRYVRKMHSANPIWGTSDAVPGFSYLRKTHSSFGWDWGPQLPDMGIWRDIYLEESSAARIEGVYIREELRGGSCRIAAEVRTEFQNIPTEYLEAGYGAAPDAELSCTVYDPEGNVIGEKSKKVSGQTVFVFPIENARRWWPVGYGDQPVYRLKLSLVSGGEEVSVREVSFGIREATVVRRQDRFGETFTFRVNGCEIFAKGANYIPEDVIIGRRSKERTERLLEDLVRSGFNCVRVWGGGFYPDDWFYDACDRLGLLVWQDFMFACAVYDLTNDFAKNIRAEVTDNVRRLRNHPSLLLWCGNNEMESAWKYWGLPEDERLRGDYLTQFERLIPTVLSKEDPDRFYWPSSPSSGGGFADPCSEDKGDAHYWDVWHGGVPFEEIEKKYFRFFSEYGFEALPDRRTLLSAMTEQDLNLSGPVMEQHQKCRGGSEKLMSYLMKYYLYPGDFDRLIYATQSLQGDYLEMAALHLRSHRDRCAGSIYWQVNDTWPTISWATIDYEGRWKGAQYIVKRAFAPLVCYAEPCTDSDEYAVYVSFDTLPAKYVPADAKDIEDWQRPGAFVWVRARLVDQEKGVLCEKEIRVRVKPLGSVCALRISPVSEFAMEEPGAYGEEKVTWSETFAEETASADLTSESLAVRNRYLSCEVFMREEESADNCNEKILARYNRLLCAPKKFGFRDPGLEAVLESGEDGKPLRITVSAAEFARRVSLAFTDADVILSDNFFDLLPGETKTVEVLEIRKDEGKKVPATEEPAAEAPASWAERLLLRSNYDIA